MAASNANSDPVKYSRAHNCGVCRRDITEEMNDAIKMHKETSENSRPGSSFDQVLSDLGYKVDESTGEGLENKQEK